MLRALPATVRVAVRRALSKVRPDDLAAVPLDPFLAGVNTGINTLACICATFTHSTPLFFINTTNR